MCSPHFISIFVLVLIRTGKCSFGQVKLAYLSVRMTSVAMDTFHSSADTQVTIKALGPLVYCEVLLLRSAIGPMGLLKLSDFWEITNKVRQFSHIFKLAYCFINSILKLYIIKIMVYSSRKPDYLYLFQ